MEHIVNKNMNAVCTFETTPEVVKELVEFLYNLGFKEELPIHYYDNCIIVEQCRTFWTCCVDKTWPIEDDPSYGLIVKNKSSFKNYIKLVYAD